MPKQNKLNRPNMVYNNTKLYIFDMPKVRTTDGHLVEWNRNAIVSQLLKDTKFCEDFYGIPSISKKEAIEIAKEVERRIIKMGVKFLSGSLIRELVNIVLLEYGHIEWHNASTRVGTSVHDAYKIDMGNGFEARDNANLQENAESLPWDEKILIKDNGKISIKPIGEIVDKAIKNAEKQGNIYQNGRSEIVFNEKKYDISAFSFNEDFIVTEVPITQFIRNKPADIYEVTTSYNKKVRVTQGHNFFCLKNGEVCSVPLSKLSVGDSILMPRRIQRKEVAYFLNGYNNLIQNLTLEEMADLFVIGEPLHNLVKENENMIRERDKNNETKNYKKCIENCGLTLDILYKINYHPSLEDLKQLKIVSWHGFKETPKIPLYYELTRELGEWLGLLLSDGCHSEHNKISFSNNDESLHRRFCELTIKLFGIMPRRKDNISIISKSVIPIKAIFSLHGKGSDKSVPDFMYDAPVECIKGFITGYHAGDGIKKEMKMTTISINICRFIRYAFLILGIIPSVYVNNRNNQKWSIAYDIGINNITRYNKLAENGIGDYNYESGGIISLIINEIGGNTGGKKSIQLWDYGRRGESLNRKTIERFIIDARKRISNTSEYILMSEFNNSSFTQKNVSEILNISINAAHEYIKRLCNSGLCEKSEKDTKYEHSIHYSYRFTDKIFNKYNKVFKLLEILSKLINGDVGFCKIKEIKKLGKEVTYDIATDTKTQNFIAGEGFLFVHNTSHKKKADKMSKEQYLLMLPKEISDAHISGDLHIHDLEYFGTRAFCIDGGTVIPVKSKNKVWMARVDEFEFENNESYPDSVYTLTPKGFKKIKKILRRPVKKGELIRIKTYSGKSIKVTKEHRIPVNKGIRVIKKAEDIKIGDVLYSYNQYAKRELFGESINSIDLVQELINHVPVNLLDDVYVRNIRYLFDWVIETGKAKNYQEISARLKILHNKKHWFTRGIMPILTFANFCEAYQIEDYHDANIGVVGSEITMPAILPITSELVEMLGFFVSEGNYNGHNLVITENEFAPQIKVYAKSTLNCYATLTHGGTDVTEIQGVKITHERAKQVYFGGKLAHLLFKYVFGIPSGCENKRLPNIVYNLDNDLLHRFLSALFTGDGSAYYRPKKSDCIINYTTTSETLRQELSLLLTSMGIDVKIVELYKDDPSRKTIYRLQINGWENIQTFSKNISFYNDRQNHINRFLSNVRGITTNTKPESVIEITPIEPSDKYVYDVFLEGDFDKSVNNKEKINDTDLSNIDEESHLFFASDGILIHNCHDWDLRYFFYYGLMPDGNGTKASVAGPAMKPEVAVLHAVKALGSAQTNYSGGQGFYNFLTFIAPYFENLSYDEIEQLMQMFVYEMTQMMVARGGQLVFSSVQLSPGVPKLWRDKPVVYKGRIWDGKQAPLRTYGEFEREVRLSFKALMNVLLKGDYWGKPFNFPKPEISIEPDFMVEDEEFNKKYPEIPTYDALYTKAFELAAKFGVPYFDNQLPEYRGAGEGISCYQCLDKDELVPIFKDGYAKIISIEKIFEEESTKPEIDVNGTEFVRLNAQAPVMSFSRFNVKLQNFKGIMRKKYKGKMLNIILESGRRIKVTPDHPLFVYTNGGFEKKTAKKLSSDDYIPVIKHDFFPEKIKIGDYIDIEKILKDGGYENSITIKNSKEFALPKKLAITSEFARFLGYYLSEGCSDHSGRRYSVRLSFGKHETRLIEDAKQCILSVFGISPLIYEEKTAVNIVVNSKLLYMFLDSLGCGHNAHDKSIPDLMYNAEKSLVSDYLYGVFKGDGEYISHANSIHIKLVSKQAVQKLVLLAQRLNIQMNYYEQIQKTTHPQTKEVYELPVFIAGISSQEQIQRFSETIRYGDIAVIDTENNRNGIFTKIPIYENPKYSSQYSSKNYMHVSPSLIDDEGMPLVRNLADGDLHLLKVKRIEESYYDDFVYDLVDVGDEHNFCNVLGIVSGNCCAYQFSSNRDSDSDFDEKLYFKDGKHFSMGSWQVISLNCPRAAYKANHDDEKLFLELKRLMDRCVDIFKIKRDWMEKILKNNRMPFATQRPKDPVTLKKGRIATDTESLVYTIGVVGINEMVQHHIGKQIHESEEARKLAIRAMFEMKFYAEELSKRHNMEIALARTPAESLPGDEYVWVKENDIIKRVKIGDIIDRYMELYSEYVEITDNSMILDLIKLNIELKTIAFNKDYKMEEAKITKLIKHGSNEIYKIRTSHGVIRTTPCHSIFTADKEGYPTPIRVSDIKVGDYIATPNSIDIPVDNSPIDLYENMKHLPNLQLIGDRETIENIYNLSNDVNNWILSNRKTSVKDTKSLWLNNNYLPVKMIQDCNLMFLDLKENKDLYLKIAYSNTLFPRYIEKHEKLGTLLGYFISEGSAYISSGKRVVQISNNNIDIINECKNIFKYYGITTYLHKDKKGTYTLHTTVSGYDFICHGLQAIDTQGNKKIPNWLFNAPLDVIISFIKAYNKGDGSIYCNNSKHDRYFRISTTNEEFANAISFLLRRIKVTPRMTIRKRDNCSSNYEYTLNIGGNDDLVRLKKLGFDVTTGQTDTSDILPNVKSIVYKLKNDLKMSKKEFAKTFESSLWMIDSYYSKSELTRSKIKHIVDIAIKKGIKSQYIDKLKKIVESDISYGKVLSIEKEGRVEHTYDFEVKPKENFLAGLGCMIAHNTTAMKFAVSDLLNEKYRNYAEPIIKGDINKALANISETRDLPIYYTNGTHIPPNSDVSLPKRIKLEEVFFPIVDGGNILHIWLGEAAPDPRGLKELAMNIARKTQVGYFAFTKDMTVCKDDFYVASGLYDRCPNCNSKNVDHLSRVTGYIQSVSGWNEGKKQELKDRKRYTIN